MQSFSFFFSLLDCNTTCNVRTKICTASRDGRVIRNIDTLDLRGLSQKFVDNMDNFGKHAGKAYQGHSYLPIILIIYTQNLNEMSLSLMSLC